MFSALLSPKGTLEPSGFLKFGFVLIGIGLLLLLSLPYVSTGGIIVLILLLLLGYPWICIWAKRLRQGGVSPAMMLAYMALYAVLYFVFYIVGFFIAGGSELTEIMGQVMSQEIGQAEAQVLMSETVDPDAVLRVMLGSGVVASIVTLFVGNMATPKQAEPV